MERDEFTQFIMSSKMNEIFSQEMIPYEDVHDNNSGINNVIEEVFHLHGHESPGTAIGAFITDYAIELMNKIYGIDIKNEETRENIYAIAETNVCLPDSIQMMTHCTIGNGKLKVYNYGRFAATIYYYNKYDSNDKNNGLGVRVRVITGKYVQDKYRDFYDWFLKRKSKQELPKARVISDIKNAKRDILDYQKIFVRHRKNRKFKIMFCKKCNEPCPNDDKGICKGCLGKQYYKVLE